MAGRQPEEEEEEELAQGPYACKVCDEVWPSRRALGGHMKAHMSNDKGKAPMMPIPFLPPAPFVDPAGPSSSMMPPVMPPRFFLPPPPPPPEIALGPHVAALAAILFGGRRPRVQVRRPQALRLRDPVVYDVGGRRIRMVPLEPNHAFWAPYRMGMDDAPVEVDFMGLRPPRRPESPSPSFGSWLNNNA